MNIINNYLTTVYFEIMHSYYFKGEKFDTSLIFFVLKINYVFLELCSCYFLVSVRFKAKR